MDLPPDKLKIVKQLPDEKKKQFIRNLVWFFLVTIFNRPFNNLKFIFLKQQVSEKQPPEYYINALKTYIDGIINQKSSVVSLICLNIVFEI